MKSITLFADPHYLIVQCVTPSDKSPDIWLGISYEDGSCNKLGISSHLVSTFITWRLEVYEPSRNTRSFPIRGILGLVYLTQGWYVLIVVRDKDVGSIEGHSVRQLQRVHAIPLSYEHVLGAVDNLASPRAFDNIEDQEEYYSEAEELEPEIPTTPLQRLGSSVKGIGTQIAHQLDNIRLAAPEVEYGRKTPEKPTSAASSMFDLSIVRSSPRHTSPTKDNTETIIQSYFQSDDEKILKELISMLTSGIFYYSHYYDLTNSYQRKHEHEGKLFFDERFWWNKHISTPFIQAEATECVVKIIQGCVQIKKCKLEAQEFEFILISRRSSRRCGLRYQMRGVDDEGDTANFVETEQIIMYQKPLEPIPHIISFLQIRGSIPLYWKQSPKTRKPVPVILRTDEANSKILCKHFEILKDNYGKQIIVSLVDQKGNEAIIGSAFKKHVETIPPEPPLIKFYEFDVHAECRGMKYENISKLIERIEPELHGIGYFWKGPKGVLSTQTGTVRTNCMDCLDRTNVVQCAIDRNVLNLQLLRLGLHSYPEKGLRYYMNFEILYNHVWANNGDAISIAYTNTSALKGDVTRTGKRNVKGVVSDGASSLLRLYHNNFRDAFRQKVINFILGNVEFGIFGSTEELAEGDETDVSDPLEDLIQYVKDSVLNEKETFLYGIGVYVVQNAMLRVRGYSTSFKFLLLTAESYYICHYDFMLEKVTQYKRIALSNIKQIMKGQLIVDVKDETNKLNGYGFAIKYSAEDEETRISGTVFNKNELFKSLYPSQRDPNGDMVDYIVIPCDDPRAFTEELVGLIIKACFADPDRIKTNFLEEVDLNAKLDQKRSLLKQMMKTLTPNKDKKKSEQ